MARQTQKVNDNRLLRPGWAGDLTPAECRYLLTRIKRSKRLQERWGILPDDPEQAEAAIRSKAICTTQDAEAVQVVIEPAGATAASLRDTPGTWIQLSLELE